jgi:hypothetical protein
LGRAMRVILLAILLLSNSAAYATGPEFAAAIGQQGFGRCHMDACNFFVIEAASPIGSAKDGTLFALAVRRWEAEYRPSNDGHEYDRPPIRIEKPRWSTELVFCSKTRPVTFYYSPEDNTWLSTNLRPGDDGSIYGAIEWAYQFYYAACHVYITRNPYGLEKLAGKLGYQRRPRGRPDASGGDADDARGVRGNGASAPRRNLMAANEGESAAPRESFWMFLQRRGF